MEKKKSKMLCRRIIDNSELGLYEIDNEDCIAIDTILYHFNLLENNIKENKLYKSNIFNYVESKDKIIEKAITEIETLRTYFSVDLQPDFIRILEILKDKNVIYW